jgi:toxin ParE1/3/4
LGIRRFSAQDNQKRAETFAEALLDACYGLSTKLSAFPLVPRYERHGIWRRSYNDHLIFYRSDIAQIDIIHITHGARDYVPLLFREGP